MTALTLTFSGSYLELLRWLIVAGIYLTIAFAAGWFWRSTKDDDA